MRRGVFLQHGKHSGRIFNVVGDKGRQPLPGLLLPGMGQLLGPSHGQQSQGGLTAQDGEQVKIIMAVWITRTGRT